MIIQARTLIRATILLVATGCANETQDSAPPADTGPVVFGKAPARTGGLPSVITLDPQPPRNFLVPDEPEIMDQIAIAFVPRLIVPRAGQLVEFHNGEEVPHTVRVVETANDSTLFNVVSLMGQPYAHTFERTGGYAVTCDLHPGMVGFVLIVSTPYVAIAEDNGDFSMSDVPPGSYMLKVWSADPARRIERVVEITGEWTELNLDPAQ